MACAELQEVGYTLAVMKPDVSVPTIGDLPMGAYAVHSLLRLHGSCFGTTGAYLANLRCIGVCMQGLHSSTPSSGGPTLTRRLGSR